MSQVVPIDFKNSEHNEYIINIVVLKTPHDYKTINNNNNNISLCVICMGVFSVIGVIVFVFVVSR